MSKFSNYATANKLVAGNRNSSLISLIGGKTLGQVGVDFKLGDDDVSLVHGERKDGTKVTALRLVINGTAYSVPFSGKMNEEEIRSHNLDWLLSCEFRANGITVLEGDKPKVDENGKRVYSTTDLVLTFGMPGGTFFNQSTSIWSDEAEVKTEAAAKAGVA